MRAAILALGIVFVFGVLWGAGELHRRNCQDAGRESCSVLPWDSGEIRHVRLTRERCLLLNEARQAQGLPPEQCPR
jgi:hypothetical protein